MPDIREVMNLCANQFIEIAREIDRKQTRLLFLDEPTAVLTETEAQILLTALKKLAESGIGIIFISHRLQEVKELCDRIVVLRDGEVIREADAGSASVRDIASWMVGRHVEEHGREGREKEGREKERRERAQSNSAASRFSPPESW